MASRRVKGFLMNLCFVMTAVIILAGDQVSKYFISRNLPLNESIEVIPNFFYITHIINTGAAFGLFQDQTFLLTVAAFIGLVLILFIAFMET